MKEGELNQEFSDRITVIDSDGSRVTGLVLTDFTYKIRNPSGTDVTGVMSPTLTELGEGVYFFKFTPNVEGIWTSWMDHATYGKWDEDYNVTNIHATVDEILTDTDTMEADIKSDISAKHVTTDALITTIDTVVDLIKIETDKIQTVDDNVDAILADTDTIEADLKTYIDGKHTTTDALITSETSDVEAHVTSEHTTTKAEINANETKIDAVKGDTATILIDTDTLEADLKTYMDTKESNIRGIDSDDLKGISDKIDPLSTEANATINTGTITSAITSAHTTTNNKIDVVDGIVDEILIDTDMLETDLKAYADIIEANIIAEIDSNESDLSAIQSTVDTILANTDTLESDLKAYLDALEISIRGVSSQDLTILYNYLVGTKSGIITEVNENEAKINIIDSLVDLIVTKLPTNYIMGSTTLDSMSATILDTNDIVSGFDSDIAAVVEMITRLTMRKEEYKILSITRNTRGKPLTVIWETYTDSTHNTVRDTYTAVTTYTALGFINTHEVRKSA